MFEELKRGTFVSFASCVTQYWNFLEKRVAWELPYLRTSATMGGSHLLWLVLSICAVGAGFAGTYYGTGNIWDAMNVAGVLVFLFLTALLIRTTRPPVTIKQRVVILAISALLLTGVTGHWIVMNSMTQWQYSQLQDIRKRMEYSLMVSYMYDHAAPVFAAYHRQPSPAKRSLAEVFLSQNPALDSETHLLMLDSLTNGLKVFATTYGDSRVILTGVSGITPGTEARFRNFDGRTGFMQSRVHMTPKGMEYEIQN